MSVRRFLVGGAVAAALALSGCGGSDGDTTGPASGGVAAPTSTSAPAPAGTTAADPAVPDPGGSATGCLAVASAVTTTLTQVAGAGFDYGKAAGEFTTGAQAVRAKLTGLSPAAAKAGEDVATAMDTAAAAAKNIDTSNPQPYLDAQQKVGTALVALGTSCGTG